MYTQLDDNPHLDYDFDCYSPSYAGFSGQYLQEIPDLLENQDLPRMSAYQYNFDSHINKELMDYSAPKEVSSTEPQGITPQISHASSYSYNTAGNHSYCFTDGGSYMNSGMDSILPGSKYLSNLSMENDTDQTVDTVRKADTPYKDSSVSEYMTNMTSQRCNLESGPCPELSQRPRQTIPPPLPEPFCDPIKELACSSMLEQTPTHPTENKEQYKLIDMTIYCSQKQEEHRHLQHNLYKQGKAYAAPVYDHSVLPFLPQKTPQQFNYLQLDHEHSTTKHSTHDRYAIPIETPYIYSNKEQSSINRQMNYQLFMRSYQYFYGLNDEELDLQQDSMTIQSNTPTPHYSPQERVTSSTLYKGLFCANKECCGLLIDNLTRSPYCSKQCQVREQNMRQARVKPRETLIRRKDSLFRLLRTLPELNFERAQIIPLVRSFLRGGLGARLKQSD